MFVRVYSGSVVPGDSVLDSTREKKERIGKIFQMHADKENPMDDGRGCSPDLGGKA